MDKHRCLKIALRMDGRLKAELGAGVDAERMLTAGLYQRDVLLVCDAMAGTELPSLAGSFRRAFTLEKPKPLLRAPLGIANLLNALFGPAETAQPAKKGLSGTSGTAGTPVTPGRRQPGATVRRPQPPGRPRRTAVRPPHRRAAR